MEEDRKVILEAYSEPGERDWYGDYNYLPNPLAHYSNSNMCKVTSEGGRSAHGFGTGFKRVETTLNFIKMMGWEKDLVYEVSSNEKAN